MDRRSGVEMTTYPRVVFVCAYPLMGACTHTRPQRGPLDPRLVGRWPTRREAVTAPRGRIAALEPPIGTTRPAGAASQPRRGLDRPPLDHFDHSPWSDVDLRGQRQHRISGATSGERRHHRQVGRSIYAVDSGLEFGGSDSLRPRRVTR